MNQLADITEFITPPKRDLFKKFSIFRKKRRSKKILFVLENFYPKIGGVEELFRSLSIGLVEKGYEVTVFTSKCGSRPAVEEHHGVKIRRSRINNRYLFNLLSFKFLILNVHRYDIVHGHFNTALPTFLVTMFRKAKLIITVHEYRDKVWFQLPFTSKIFQLLHYAYEKVVIRLPCVHFVAVSEQTRDDLLDNGLSAEKITLIYNGLDYRAYAPYQWEPDAQKPFTYTYFGRLGKCKGLNLLMQAAPKMVDKYPESRLNLIIPKQPRSIYEYVMKKIARNNLEGNVRIFHNLTRNDMLKVLQQSDCVVIPSYYEGFCFSAAEAIAMGIPVISSNTGALKNVVSGYYLNMHEMTTDHLLECLTDAAEGRWLYKPVRKFTLEENIEGHVRLYSRILKSKKIQQLATV